MLREAQRAGLWTFSWQSYRNSLAGDRLALGRKLHGALGKACPIVQACWNPPNLLIHTDGYPACPFAFFPYGLWSIFVVFGLWFHGPAVGRSLRWGDHYRYIYIYIHFIHYFNTSTRPPTNGLANGLANAFANAFANALANAFGECLWRHRATAAARSLTIRCTVWIPV